METALILSTILTGVLVIVLYSLLSSIRDSTKTNKRLTHLNALLLQKMLEKHGENVDLKELYKQSERI